MKKCSKALAVIAAICMILSTAACANNNAAVDAPATTAPAAQATEAPAATPNPAEEQDMPEALPDEYNLLLPFSKNPEPITISVGRMNNAGGLFAPGQDSENNGVTQLLKDELNIIIDVKTNGFDVDAPDYENTLALRIASNNLPDTFQIIDNSNKGMQLFKQLVEGNKLADLSELYPDVIGGRSREQLDATDLNELQQFMSVNGKLYGVTSGSEGYNTAVLWIRKDWLDKCGLQLPKTVEDVAAVALEFVKQKPGGQANTIGVPVNPDVQNGGMFGQWMGILPVFNSVGSYPDIWIQDNSGQIVNGAIQPETKVALGILAEWTQNGVLDKNMITMKNGDEVRDTYLATNACGMIFQAWWDPWPQWNGLGDASVNNDASIEWVPVMAPLNSEGKFIAKNESILPGGQVVSASCPYAAEVLKGMNLLAEVETYRNPDFKALRDKYIKPLEGISEMRTNSPFRNLVVVQGRMLHAEAINNYRATGTLNLDPRIEDARDYIEGAYAWEKNNTMADWYKDKNEADADKYMFQYVGHMAYDVCANLYASQEKAGVYSERMQYPGNTDSIADYGAMLNDLRNTAFMQIISGAKPLDYFDEFVTQWKAIGGDIITAEMNQ